jgi:hypothetical protein
LNIGMRYLTTRDVTRLKGMDSIEELTEVDSATAAQPLKPVEYPEYQVPELPVVVPPPTNADIQRTIAEIQASTHSLMEERVAAAAFGQAETSVMQPTAGIEQGVQNNTSEIMLQNPTGASNQFSEQQPAEVITAEGNEPVIMIDTSPEALAAEGLVENEARPPQYMNTFHPQSVRKVRRSFPRQQMNPYMNQQQQQQMQQMQMQPSMEQQMEGAEERTSVGGTNTPIQVVKLG